VTTEAMIPAAGWVIQAVFVAVSSSTITITVSKIKPVSGIDLERAFIEYGFLNCRYCTFL
jgi:hypothetical protein